MDENLKGLELNDMPHLIPAAQGVAALNDEKRLQHLRKEIWIGYTKAGQALSKLETLFCHPARQRMPNLLLVGPTNNGKSMVIQKFKRLKHSTSVTMTDKESIPVIHMQMPSEPNVHRFYGMLLSTIGAPYLSRMRISDLETLTLKVLRQIGPRILVIDEVHNILAGSATSQREFLNLLRFLGNELQLPLVCVGTRDAYLAIRSDDQLENRFEPMVLPLWQNDEEYLSLLASFATVLPLRRPSNLHHPDLAHYILMQSEGIIGEIAAFLFRAAALAIETKDESLSLALLKKADYKSPSDRKRTFERLLA